MLFLCKPSRFEWHPPSLYFFFLLCPWVITSLLPGTFSPFFPPSCLVVFSVLVPQLLLSSQSSLFSVSFGTLFLCLWEGFPLPKRVFGRIYTWNRLSPLLVSHIHP
ncbi:hypothetical protein DL96DRAFT_35278 [Flagelloscypha sp. PMI_526]|nr:hypothetical protein DL96DRAFT_35278 [Flagelloscypha sp. PMI_526]